MVIDVTDADFPVAVLERSHSVPVVVDFWAAWCAPCRQLGPVLESAVADREGQVVLAKLDVDANPAAALRYGVQGIPAVKAFRDGAVAAEFVGAKPPAAVAQFLDGLVPSERDGLVAAGDEASLRRALELEPARPDAAVPLARMLLARGEADEALRLVEHLPGSFAAEGLAARIRLEREHDAALASAFAALDAGEPERGLELLLEALAASNGSREDLRRVVVGVLDDLGVEHPLAREYRRKLSAVLY